MCSLADRVTVMRSRMCSLADRVTVLRSRMCSLTDRVTGGHFGPEIKDV